MCETTAAVRIVAQAELSTRRLLLRFRLSRCIIMDPKQEATYPLPPPADYPAPPPASYPPPPALYLSSPPGPANDLPLPDHVPDYLAPPPQRAAKGTAGLPTVAPAEAEQPPVASQEHVWCYFLVGVLLGLFFDVFALIPACFLRELRHSKRKCKYYTYGVVLWSPASFSWCALLSSWRGVKARQRGP